MSDMYLILRRRLNDVVDWVELETETLRHARKGQGYSYETMGNLLHVSSKTWERYEKDGRIPRHLLSQVAEVLELEIVTAPAVTVSITPQGPAAGDKLDQMLHLLREVRDGQDALEARLAALEDDKARQAPA